MKERIVLFSDAVIAIILTVMVIEIPVSFMHGELELFKLGQSVAIYFISFCFVANLWFQTAKAFEKVTDVKNKTLVFYLLLLFLLSLVPKATELIIEDTSRQIMLIYGTLTFVVTLLVQQILLVLTKQEIKETPTKDDYKYQSLKRRNLVEIGLRLFVLVIAYFYPVIGLVIYSLVPVVSFLQNISDEEEAEFVDQLDTEQKDYYLQDMKQFWGNPLNKYSKLVGSSLGADPDQASRVQANWQRRFEQNWQGELAQRLDRIDQRIQQTTNENEKANLARAKEQLQKEQVRIDERLQGADRHTQRRHLKNETKLQKDLAKIAAETAELETELAATTENKKQVKLREKIAELAAEKQKILLEFETEKDKINVRANEEARKTQKRIDRMRDR